MLLFGNYSKCKPWKIDKYFRENFWSRLCLRFGIWKEGVVSRFSKRLEHARPTVHHPRRKEISASSDLPLWSRWRRNFPDAGISLTPANISQYSPNMGSLIWEKAPPSYRVSVSFILKRYFLKLQLFCHCLITFCCFHFRVGQ